MHSSSTIGSEIMYCIWHWWYPHDDMHISLQDGWTALMKALWAGKVECVKVLLDMGAEVNMQNEVNGVIIHCVHAMQHVPRVPPISGGCTCMY